MLGKLLSNHDYQRDAIHIAIAPMTAGERLAPGQHVGIIEHGVVGISESLVGIIDPFLTRPVEPGERCYLCMYPETVTAVRHVWSHPAFKAQNERTVSGPVAGQ